MERRRLSELTSKLQSGDGIPASKIKTAGLYPVFGGNGLRGFTDSYNEDGSFFFIGRQGAKCGNVHYHVGKAYMTEHAVVGIASADNDAIYLAYKLSLLNLGKLQGQSAQPGLAVGTLANVEIDVPSSLEQKKIGKLLYRLDQKIALNTRMNAELEAMAKQLYDYWFVQFDFPDENGNPYKSSGGKMVYNPTLKREIPAGWEDGVLSDIANITMGQSPDGSSYNENGEGTIFYQGSTDFGIRFPSVRMYTTAPTRFASKGDILMSVRAPVGDTNIANTDCCIGRGLSAINSKIGSISHLYHIIRDLKAKFDIVNAAGTTFGAITKDELFNLTIVKPDGDILRKYEAFCSPLFDKQMKIGYEIDRLTHLRDSLLPMLMNGQVTVE